MRHLLTLLGIRRATLFVWIERHAFPGGIWIGPSRKWAKAAVREWLIANGGKRKRDHLEKMRGARRARA
jgi:predicted DNA-binding transcriptional regulator AlpA